nr:probable glutathione S-transferase [Ipomoea batatas]
MAATSWAIAAFSCLGDDSSLGDDINNIFLLGGRRRPQLLLPGQRWLGSEEGQPTAGQVQHIESPISPRTTIECDGNAGQSVEEINSTPNDTDDNTNNSNDEPCDDILSASQSPQVPDLPQLRRSTRMRNAPPKLHDYYCNFMMEDKPVHQIGLADIAGMWKEDLLNSKVIKENLPSRDELVAYLGPYYTKVFM